MPDRSATFAKTTAIGNSPEIWALTTPNQPRSPTIGLGMVTQHAYCRALFLAKDIPANETAGAMTDDRAMTGLGSGKAQPDSASSNRRPATDKGDNFAELSPRLGERAPPPAAVGPVAPKAAR